MHQPIRCQSLLLTAPRKMQWVAETLAAPQAHEVVVQTIAGAISLGTELPIYRGTHRGTHSLTYPRMTGYESYAEVMSCGAAVDDLRVGDRVVAFYGHRTHAVLAAERVIPVEKSIPGPLALLTILACDVTKGINKLDLHTDAQVLITGAGTIGLLALFNLLARDIKQVDMVEPIASRRTLATAFGVRNVVSPTRAASLPADYTAAIECSSRNSAFALLQEHLCTGGRLCVLADGNLEPLTLLPAFHEKELQVVGSSDGEDYRGYATWFWPHAQRYANSLMRLYERTIAAAQLAETFAKLAADPHPPIKVLVQYPLRSGSSA